MILSIAHASVEDASDMNMFGIWSNLVVGTRPSGLMDCYLVEGHGSVQVVAVWESLEAHDSAVEDDGSHPAHGFFKACGIDPTHAVYEIVGSLG